MTHNLRAVVVVAVFVVVVFKYVSMHNLVLFIIVFNDFSLHTKSEISRK